MATPHTCATTKKFFEENQISVLKWPANSPDMSPIELAWKLLKDIVYQKKIFTSVAELWSEVQKSLVIFNSTKRQTMKKIIENLSQKYLDVLVSGGKLS